MYAKAQLANTNGGSIDIKAKMKTTKSIEKKGTLSVSYTHLTLPTKA